MIIIRSGEIYEDEGYLVGAEFVSKSVSGCCNDCVQCFTCIWWRFYGYDRRSIDLLAIATHEFGHSHGLSHMLNNLISDTDGTGATMYPFFDVGDPNDELGFRSLSQDDIAWSSYKYQEGTSWDPDNPAYAGKGDIPFENKYGVIKGELKHGIYNEPIAGGELFAVKKNTNTVVASAFSGTTRFSFNTSNGRLAYNWILLLAKYLDLIILVNESALILLTYLPDLFMRFELQHHRLHR